jgi:hypothetical protein
MGLNEANTYGFPQGSVDSNKVVIGGTNNDWGGSMERALEIADYAKSCSDKKNLISSQKRSRIKTASGNVSDHYEGNLSAYAVDLSTSGKKGDELLKCIMSKFNNGSNSDYTGGKWLNVNKDGYRYQFGWKVPNHYDHIHVGVKKIGSKDSEEVVKELPNKETVKLAKFDEKSKVNLNKLIDKLRIKGVLNPVDEIKKWLGSTTKSNKVMTFKDLINSDEYKAILKHLNTEEYNHMNEEVGRIKDIMKKII